VVWLCAPDPGQAVYIGPPADELPRLLDDFVAYLARDDVSACEQAAVAFGQLEFIHPFRDGNGRMGRCLMQVIGLRRGLVSTVAPPLGLLFHADLANFLGGHRAYRDGRVETWCRYVAELAVASAQSVAITARDR
jgi:Fic family protein